MASHAPHPCRFDSREDRRRCPRTGKLIEPRAPRPWMLWLLPITGLLALAWFLVRVVPKPSRALYPCQRVAMPLASGFVAWLLGIAASVAALRKARSSLHGRRYTLALAAIGISVAAIWVTLSITAERTLLAEPQSANEPIGVARGIHPGRVVWVHDPDATDWKGPGDGHLWQDDHTNPAAVDQMMAQALRNLTGETSDKAAWDALFRYHNKTRGKGDIGYQPGQRITVKVNFVGFIRTTDAVNPQTYALRSWVDYMNTSPQMIASLLRQLTETVGVRQSDIAVGDTLAYFAKDYYDMLHRQFPLVTYLDCQGGPGRTKSEPSSIPLHWSCNTEGCAQDYVPQAYAEADYLINLANLKAHPSAGVTLCAKNHYGSLIRLPYEKGYYDMHTSFQKATGRYRNLVDLMSHSELGGKTVLYLVDGLYGGIHYVEQVPRRPPGRGQRSEVLLHAGHGRLFA